MAQAATPTNQFQILKLYVKEASFEAPEALTIFKEGWTPELNIELHTATKALAEANTHEVVLTVKCMVSNQKKNAFTVEAKQAGIFQIPVSDQEELKRTLGILCPTILYPYLREVVSDLVQKGGFPQLSLAPINFELIYQQQTVTATSNA